jgi:outer membrane protein insertion porin family
VSNSKTQSLKDANRIQTIGRFWIAAMVTLLCLRGVGICVHAAENGEPDSELFGRTIHEISYSSDRPLDRAHFDPFLGLKPGDVLTRTGVKTAIQSLYESGRFSRIVVDAFPAGDSVDLRFNLRLNDYFNKFAIEGGVDLKGRSLWELVSLPIGQRFTEEKLEDSRQEVLKFMRERGYYLAQVEAQTKRDEKMRQIDTVFVVRPGTLATIRSIEINGVPSPGSEDLKKKFGIRKGRKFDRARLNSRLGILRRYFLRRGYLAAVAEISEHFEPETNRVDLILNVSNYGRVRVVVDGFGIDKNQLRRLLPILTGEGINPDILQEGLDNLKDYLETRGYSEADVKIEETTEKSGVRVIHYIILPGRKFTAAYVRFKGNRAIPDRELLAVLEIQPTSPYSISKLDDDVTALKDLYQTLGYLQANVIPLVEPSKDGKKVGIVYLCGEGPKSRLLSLEIRGNEAISKTELMAKIKLTPGSPYSPSLAEQDRQALLAAYNDRGYLQAQVAVRVGQPDGNNSYPVEYEIREGRQSIVDRILVLGNGFTKKSIISKKIKLKENEPLSLGKLLQTQQSLYSMGVFDQVRVAPQNPDSTAPYQDVVVRLQESKRFTIRYGFGYQEREKLRGTLEFSHLNFFGWGRRADLRFRGSSIEQQAILSFQQPQFRAVPVDSYLTFSALQRRDVSFDSRRFNLSYQFSHPFGSHSWGMIRYNFKNVRISNTLLDPSELGREDQPVSLSTFSTAFVNDTRDNYLDPEKGFFSSTDFGVTPKLWGRYEYFTFFSQNSYYRKLPQSFLMASSLRIGAAHPFGGVPDLPISERFFAGGSSSLRGFDTDYAGPLDPVFNKPIGGNALLVASLEIRRPVYRFIHFASFYDTGNVFRNINGITFSGFSHTLGIGLRIKTPFGPLRADYGYNLNLSSVLRQQGLKRGHLFITIGPPF